MNDLPNFEDFSDNDQTIVRPTPGGRKPAAPTAPRPAEEFSFNALGLALAATPGGFLANAASPLLSLAAQLRNTASHPDIAALRSSTIEAVQQFDHTIKQQGFPLHQAQAARYALCTFLDETILNTPWGCNSLWSSQSLLIFFHKEAWGGERFFLILKNCLQQPATHTELLELLYFCLSLGFEGRYRVAEHGASKLEDLRANVYLVLQSLRGDPEPALSVHWQGVEDQRHLLSRWVPLWVIGGIGSLALTLIFLGFLYFINLAANPVLARLYALKDSFAVQPAVATPVVAEPLLTRLAGFLEPEVKSGTVELLEKDGKTVIRIVGKGLFASGSDQLMTAFYPLLGRIGTALTEVPKRVLVVGHTDSSPIFSARFPSNWDLSKARAVAVAELLKASGNRQPVTVEGRADTQPLVPNDTPEHKAMNRRVEILI